MNTPRNAIVVGISADGYDSALEFAVAEAKRASRPLHLVHVLQLPGGDAYAGAYGGFSAELYMKHGEWKAGITYLLVMGWLALRVIRGV